MSKLPHKIEKHFDTIGQRGSETIEFNLVKGGSNSPKYDIRKWAGGIPGKGVSLSREELEKLLLAIGLEVGLFKLPDDEEMPFDESNGEEMTSEEVMELFDNVPLISEEVSEEEEQSEDIKYYEIDFRSFFIHGGEGRCNKSGHDEQEEVIAKIKVLGRFNDEYDVDFPATYCKKCNCYYVSSRTYERVRKIGRPLCQLMSTDEYAKYKSQNFKGDNLLPQSVLNMAGYNVNSIDNLSDSHRQAILSYVIDCGLLSKKRVVEYLTYFIKMHEGKANFSNAIEKWRKDKDFLTGYYTREKRVVGVKRIIG